MELAASNVEYQRLEEIRDRALLMFGSELDTLLDELYIENESHHRSPESLYRALNDALDDTLDRAAKYLGDYARTVGLRI